jgi:hypothetical protein
MSLGLNCVETMYVKIPISSGLVQSTSNNISGSSYMHALFTLNLLKV